MSQTIPSSFEQALLIRSAQLYMGEVFDGQVLTNGQCDVRIAQGKIIAIESTLTAQDNDFVIEAKGNLLLPGLQDHHLHLFATASARASVSCGPPEVNNADELRRALQGASGTDWLRGVGFHDSVCAELNRDWLDQVCPQRPVRIQHRSGMLWILNSAALKQIEHQQSECSQSVWPEGAERDQQGRLTGRFYNLDTWLGKHLPRAWPSLLSLSQELAGYGITAVTDTGVNNNAEVWSALTEASERGELLQRTLVMGSEALSEVAPSVAAKLSLGPLKLYLREVDLPDLEEFTQRIVDAHNHHRAVAVHCVTRVEMFFVLAAFAQAGVLSGDRIEHASIADEDIVQRMAELGIIAVSQPHFIAERGDQYLKDVDADDVPWLYRGASFIKRGVRLAAGSDAPYGGTNPWAAMDAAVKRQTRTGVIMSPAECLTPEQALGLFGGTPAQPGGGLRALAVGQNADVCLLNNTWQQLRSDLSKPQVLLTLCAGEVIYQSASAWLR